MAPHMSGAELDRAAALHSAGKTPVEVRALLQRARTARGQPGPDFTTVRRALRGATGKRARVETRGRKAKLTIVKLRALDAARRRLIQRAKGETEVHGGLGPGRVVADPMFCTVAGSCRIVAEYFLHSCRRFG